jgi:hypothetical protein
MRCPMRPGMIAPHRDHAWLKMEGLAGAPCVLTRVIAPDQQAQRLVA